MGRGGSENKPLSGGTYKIKASNIMIVDSESVIEDK